MFPTWQNGAHSPNSSRVGLEASSFCVAKSRASSCACVSCVCVGSLVMAPGPTATRVKNKTCASPSALATNFSTTRTKTKSLRALSWHFFFIIILQMDVCVEASKVRVSSRSDTDDGLLSMQPQRLTKASETVRHLAHYFHLASCGCTALAPVLFAAPVENPRWPGDEDETHSAHYFWLPFDFDRASLLRAI